MVFYSKFNYNTSLLVIVSMNVLAFILCLCAIFLPSMPNEDGKLFFFYFFPIRIFFLLLFVVLCVFLYFLTPSRYFNQTVGVSVCVRIHKCVYMCVRVFFSTVCVLFVYVCYACADFQNCTNF